MKDWYGKTGLGFVVFAGLAYIVTVGGCPAPSDPAITALETRLDAFETRLDDALGIARIDAARIDATFDLYDATLEMYRVHAQDYAMMTAFRAVATAMPKAGLTIDGKPIRPFPITREEPDLDVAPLPDEAPKNGTP